MLIQQGDVLIKKCDSIPEGLHRKNNHLAEGEVTGHFHAVYGGDTAVWGDLEGNLFLDVKSECEVRHQEHGTVSVPPGKYEIGIVREYDHFAEEARAVQD